MYHQRIFALATAGAISIFSGNGVAQADTQGEFRMTLSQSHDYISFEHAEGVVTGGHLTGTFYLFDSNDELFPEGAIGLASCVVLARQSESGLQLEAPCTMTFGSEDQMFILAHRELGEVGEGGAGAGSVEILGGTGKFEGVGGECSYQADYLQGELVVNTSNCSWEK